MPAYGLCFRYRFRSKAMGDASCSVFFLRSFLALCAPLGLSWDSSGSLLASLGSALELFDTNLDDFTFQVYPKVAFSDRFSWLVGVPAHMWERSSRRSPSMIERLLGDQKINVCSILYLDGYTGTFWKHSVMTFCDFGIPKGAHWNPRGFVNDRKDDEKEGALCSGALEGPWVPVERIFRLFTRFRIYFIRI